MTAPVLTTADLGILADRFALAFLRGRMSDESYQETVRVLAEARQWLGWLALISPGREPVTVAQWGGAS